MSVHHQSFVLFGYELDTDDVTAVGDGTGLMDNPLYQEHNYRNSDTDGLTLFYDGPSNRLAPYSYYDKWNRSSVTYYEHRGPNLASV